MARIGADIGQLEALGKTFQAKADEVQQLTNNITTQVINVDWEGPAYDKFRSEWDTNFKRNLQNLQQALMVMSQEAKKRADAIRQAGS